MSAVPCVCMVGQAGIPRGAAACQRRSCAACRVAWPIYPRRSSPLPSPLLPLPLCTRLLVGQEHLLSARERARDAARATQFPHVRERAGLRASAPAAAAAAAHVRVLKRL